MVRISNVEKGEKTQIYDHINVLRVQQLTARIAILILTIYIVYGFQKYDPFSDSYDNKLYLETLYRFRLSTLILIILGYFTPYLSTHVFSGVVELGYVSLIALIITLFHWLDGAPLSFDYFYTSYALTLVQFHPFLYGPISLGHIHDSLYIQCVINIFLTSTAILISSLALLTDRLDFFWKVPIPLYISSYISMFLSSLTNLLPFSRPAIRCN